ncbi:MAG TPA: response regulator [Terriglobia bacterium]|nr:response regulator [Terriglobia bacterium]
MTQTILVADDSPTMQRLANSLLMAEGLEVVTVSNGVAAIKKLPTVRPDLILADVAMPGKDGYEVCEFVKNSAAIRHIPVLLIFSELEPYQPDRGERVHADGSVKKPFNQDDLIAAVTKFLAQATQSPSTAPPFATAPADFEPDPAAEPVEAPPQAASALPEFNLAALSEGVALSAPAEEKSAESMSDIQTFPSAAERVPVPDGSMASEASTSKLAPSATSAPAEGAEQTEPESDASEQEALSRGTAEAAGQSGGNLAAQTPELETKPEAAPAPPEWEVEREEAPAQPAEREQAAMPPAAAPEAPSPDGQERVTEPDPPSVVPETQFAASGPEAFGSNPDAPPPGESFRAEFPADPVYRFGDVQTKAQPATEDEAPNQISDAAELSSEPQPALAENQFAVEEASPPAAREAKPEKLDPELIYTIVHKVVLKMSPPALEAEVVESIARQITSELTAEFNSDPS